MRVIDIEKIQNRENRTRVPTEEAIDALAESIKDKGLLQPIVVDNLERLNLVAGDTRLRAIEKLSLTESNYRHNGTSINTSKAVFVTVGELTPAQLIEYEIAENIIRTDLTWQERTEAFAKLHRAYQEVPKDETLEDEAAQNPRVAYLNTAKQLINDAKINRNEHRLADTIEKSVILNTLMDDVPEIANAKTLSEAWSAARKYATELGQKALENAADKVTVEPEWTIPHTLIIGDVNDHWGSLPPVNLIISDPPYGTEADSWTTKFKETPHRYDDSYETGMGIARDIFDNGFRHTVENGHIYMFCAPQFWNELRLMAEASGWVVWPRPIIWYKSREGIRPWGQAGFAYTYETILYATKQHGLIRSINDVIDIYKVSRHGRLHGAQKPVDLYEQLIRTCCMPGQTIFDPTCGSGTIFPAANRTKTIAIGIEENHELEPVIRRRLIEDIAHATPLEESIDDLEDL